ncbi:MAG: hypothetical protein EAZ30_13340 [Betaproteobacteria bacterium]|nr:MAG: hypothetical protein EAZ30_13340 [Betaproteobacteria bacterium]
MVRRSPALRAPNATFYWSGSAVIDVHMGSSGRTRAAPKASSDGDATASGARQLFSTNLV